MPTLKLLEDIESALGRVEQSAGRTVEKLQQTQAEVERYASEVEPELSRVEQAADLHHSQMDAQMTELRGFIAQYSKDAGGWTQEIQEHLDLIGVGGERIDEFLGKWGSAVVTTQDGATTIREIFDGLDLRGKEQEVQSLAGELQTGKKTVGEALEFLAEAGGRYADELRQVVQAVQDGRAPIEHLVSLVRQIEVLAGDNSAFASLAGALQAALRGEKL